MAKLKVDEALLRAKSRERRGEMGEARQLYEAILHAYPGNRRARERLTRLAAAREAQPPAARMEALAALCRQGRHAEAAEEARALLAAFPASFLVWNALGAAEMGRGKAQQAAAAFREAEALNPRFADGPFNLGNALLALDAREDAIACFDRAIALRPDHAEAHFNRASAHREAGRPEVAAEGYRRSLRIRPGWPEALVNLGNTLKALGQPEEAMARYREALAARPGYGQAHTNLGVVLREAGRPQEAAEQHRMAVAAEPRHADAHVNLGNALLALAQPEEAEAAFRAAVALRPDHAPSHSALAAALRARGQLEEAEAACRASLALSPGFAEAHNNLGVILRDQGRIADAIAAYRAALAAAPEHAEAHNNLGNALKDSDAPEAAVACYRRALAARPAYPEALNNLAVTLRGLGRLEEAIACHAAAIALRPGFAKARAMLLHQKAHACDWSWVADFAGHAATLGIEGEKAPPFATLAAEDDPERQMRRSVRWAAESFRHIAPPCPVRPPGGRIRLGYFSADFHDHATLHLMTGLLREHDRARFEIHAFSYGRATGDAMQEQLAGSVDALHDVRALPDAQIVALARARGIDIALDLKGYTQDGRPEIFARRPAPLQVAYLGYPGTSGAPFMDYLVADPVVAPPEARPFYTERLILMPRSYQPNDDCRAIAEAPASRADFGLPEDAFVFCCFNQSYKIGPREFDIWARLLQAVPGSVLWLLGCHPAAEANLRREATARGVDPARLVFAGRLPHAEHLARHRHADLFLDTFAVNAHTTASDALWAGLPVLTRAGRQFAARVAASLLHALDLPHLVSDNDADYERRALALATRPEALAALKAQLAQARKTAPLFATADYARAFEAALETAWHARRSGAPLKDIAMPP